MLRIMSNTLQSRLNLFNTIPLQYVCMFARNVNTWTQPDTKCLPAPLVYLWFVSAFGFSRCADAVVVGLAMLPRQDGIMPVLSISVSGAPNVPFQLDTSDLRLGSAYVGYRLHGMAWWWPRRTCRTSGFRWIFVDATHIQRLVLTVRQPDLDFWELFSSISGRHLSILLVRIFIHPPADVNHARRGVFGAWFRRWDNTARTRVFVF